MPRPAQSDHAARSTGGRHIHREAAGSACRKTGELVCANCFPNDGGVFYMRSKNGVATDLFLNGKPQLASIGLVRPLRTRRLSTVLLSSLSVLLSTALTPISAFASPQDSAVDAKLIAEAYDYAYPTFALSQFRWKALNERGNRTSTTLNTFVHQRAMTTPDDTWAASPLVDCLYSTAWLDLTMGPVILTTPDTHDRYYVLTLIDYFSNTFMSAGARTTGTAPQKYLVVGPDWNGLSPEGVKVVRSPTNDVYINLRVFIDGPADQVAANAVQSGFSLHQEKPAPSRRPSPIKPVRGDLENYIAVVNQAIANNPPPKQDDELTRRFRAVGICGADCGWEKLPENVRKAWRENFDRLTHQFDQALDRPWTGRPGWINYAPPGSKMGSAARRDYHRRASEISHGTGMLGLAPAEATYAGAGYGDDGQALVGSKKYRLHIPPGGIPSNVFWSVTLYEFKHGSEFLTPNPLNRHRVGSRTPEFFRNADGSIDVWIQSTPPAGKKATNWLPSPSNDGRFWLIARSYGPKSEVLEGKFSLPPVEVVQ